MPIVGSVFFGLGYMLISQFNATSYTDSRFSVFSVFQGVITFLVDAYPLYAASALAANAFFEAVLPLRSLSLVSKVGFLFPLGREVYHVADNLSFTVYAALGYQWATSLLAFLTVAMLPLP
jgi:hypothetical protein